MEGETDEGRDLWTLLMTWLSTNAMHTTQTHQTGPRPGHGQLPVAQANQICKDTMVNSNAHDFCHDKFGDVIYSVGSCVADILVREKSILTVSHTHKQKHSAPFEFNKTSFFQKPSKFH